MTDRGRVVLGVISAIIGMVAAALLVATVALGVLVAGRGPDGFVESAERSLSSDGYAITVENIDFGSVPEELVPDSLLGTFRVEAASETDSPIFIGVGPSDAVASYLQSVAYTEVTRFGSWGRTRYEDHSGTVVPRTAASETFWTAVAEGAGPQTLDWEPRTGTWTVVVMNSDSAPGVDVSATVGVESPWIVVAFVVSAFGTALATLAALLILIFALRRPQPRAERVEEPQLTGPQS